ncbi:MAG: phosphotransferase, partial [Acetobacteraceae bacterium]
MIPHAGAMCLLDHVTEWSATGIRAVARSHLDPVNPLRRNGRLSAICGSEYALQAAALHGALVGGGRPQPAGRLVALRLERISVSRL